ncbi:MAG: hypothetical protein K2R98_02050 [Gemmataceae bacterium]|nr:hypothetical protein [Gemmataceae bacterium]
MRSWSCFIVLAVLTSFLPAQDKKEKKPEIDKDQLAGVEDRKPVLSADDNAKEYRAYCYLVLHASEVPVDALAKVARKNVTYAQLYEDPGKYRGEPIHIAGRLRRLVKMDAPKGLANDGIKTLYEGWIFPEDDGTNPYAVIFTELPNGVETGEKTFYRVTCDAYFFKRYRYKSVNNDTRDAPLLIGRTFALQKESK